MSLIETYYLIDYENVHGEGLKGCNYLTEKDHIIIFFTDNAKNMDMRDISDHGEATLRMEQIPVRKQSTDMHIVSYMGYLAGKYDKDCKVVVVSKDTDFDNVINYWKDKFGIAASRTQQIMEQKPQKQKNETTAKTSQTSEKKVKFNQEIMQAVRSEGYTADVANNVAKIASGLYGNEQMLSEMHNALRLEYTDYLDVYKAIKPVLSKYADSNPVKEKNKASDSSKEKQNKNNEILKTLSKAGYSNEIASYVASTVVKNFGAKKGKQQIYRAIISKYGQKKGLDVYQHIKKLI